MTSASVSLLSLRLAAFVSLCLLRGCWKVGIGITVLAEFPAQNGDRF